MKVSTVVVSLVAFASACGYGHIGATSATFNSVAPALGSEATSAPARPLVLRIRRHLDTVIGGPDFEEDQLLVLTVRDFQLNQRLAIPSENVTPEFTATRFGPSSTGDSFLGYLIVRTVTTNQVAAYVHVDVTAHTESGSYTQQAKFRGEYKFFRETDND
ncbi:MAG TPA: hypothetical protein VL486_00390 [Verrucomicrobiae bacterium]|nr:hypothetical protein [Verrucomicrobiae bacterium]